MTLKKLNIKALAMAAALAAALPAAAASADEPVTNLRVANVEVFPHDGKLSVMLEIDARHIRPGIDREVNFTPMVRSLEGADSLVLPSFKVCGRNRYYSHLRNGDLADGDIIIQAGHRSAASTYTVTVPWQEWMAHSRVEMSETVAHCCDAPVNFAFTPVAEIDQTPQVLEAPARYVSLTGDSAVTRSREGQARIIFKLDSIDVNPAYKTNRAQLDSIYATINFAANDPDAVITSIHLKGFASPEGTYKHNVELAMGRTNAIREVVRRHYGLNPEIMHTTYEPENWEGLIDWLENHQISHRDQILAIARDETIDPDPRDLKIKREYPTEYKFLLDSVYPWLRMTNYRVNYEFKVFDSIDKLLDVYRDDPTKLRPVDFSRIAATMPEGSARYDSVYMTAVKVWPKDPLANLNAANILLKRADALGGAERDRLLDQIERYYLADAGSSAEAYYARGSLAARRGDLELALTFMQRAADLGFDQAKEEQRRLAELIARPQVSYLLPEGVVTGDRAKDKTIKQN